MMLSVRASDTYNYGLTRRNLAIILCISAILAGCRSVEKRIAPSNFRDWAPEQAVLPQADIRASRVTIRNVRSSRYFANDVYLVDYYDKTFDLNAVRSVDFIVVPFVGMPALAHTMLSFKIIAAEGKRASLGGGVE